ncbi:hypothetical protein [Kitasatospora sp. GAS1066B]|uniref:hypothetical protein n=1 Tax=Kitasatospora sp. GAS1066B TaxID=3156271 RepID=UPI0035153AA5
MTPAQDQISIHPGLHGVVQVTGAGPAALEVIAPLGFRAPLKGPGPVRLNSLDGPAQQKAVAGQAARRLREAGHHVDLHPALHTSERGERAMEMLAGISARLAELQALAEETEHPGELADLLGQLTTGRGNAMDALEQMLRACAQAVRTTTDPGQHDLIGRITADAGRIGESSAGLARWSSALRTIDIHAGNRRRAATASSPWADASLGRPSTHSYPGPTPTNAVAAPTRRPV